MPEKNGTDKSLFLRKLDVENSINGGRSYAGVTFVDGNSMVHPTGEHQVFSGFESGETPDDALFYAVREAISSQTNSDLSKADYATDVVDQSGGMTRAGVVVTLNSTAVPAEGVGGSIHEARANAYAEGLVALAQRGA